MAMTLRLTPADEQILADLADSQGVSRQEATIRAIREAAARQGHEQAVDRLSAPSPLTLCLLAGSSRTVTSYLTLEDLLALADDLGVGPVRDVGLLESAVHRHRP